jgi:hypothetical protein
MTSRVVWSVRIRHCAAGRGSLPIEHVISVDTTGTPPCVRDSSGSDPGIQLRRHCSPTLEAERSDTPREPPPFPPSDVSDFRCTRHATRPPSRPTRTHTLTNQRTKSKPNLNNPGPPQPPTTNPTPVVGSLAFFFFFLGTPGKCDTLGRHTTAQQFSSERPSLSLSPPLDNQPTISTTSIKQRQ